MKLALFCLALISLGLCGCESETDIPGEVAQLAKRGEPKTRDFAADQKTTYEAAKAALAAIDFRFIKGGRAEGKIEALSGLSQGDTINSTRQVSLKITMEPNADGGTEVSILFSELIEADPTHQEGMATETPMTDTPLYEVFFRTLQQNLNAQPKA